MSFYTDCITKPFDVCDGFAGVFNLIDTSYRSFGGRGGPNYTSVSHCFRSAPGVSDGQRGRWNWSSIRRHYALKYIGRQQLINWP